MEHYLAERSMLFGKVTSPHHRVEELISLRLAKGEHLDLHPVRLRK